MKSDKCLFCAHTIGQHSLTGECTSKSCHCRKFVPGLVKHKDIRNKYEHREQVSNIKCPMCRHKAHPYYHCFKTKCKCKHNNPIVHWN